MDSRGSEAYRHGDLEAADGSLGAKVARWSIRECRDLLAATAAGPDTDDVRFRDPAWDTAVYRLLLRSYLAWRNLVLAGAEAPFVPARRRSQAQFIAQVVTEALAPTNTLLGNPAALRRAVATRGASLVRGAGNLLEDLRHRRGRPAKMPPGSYHLGRDLATTPGRVVYRDDLVEVLQYEPQTAEVHQVPLLLVPAWVNKFYIFDLAPGRSLVEWAVRAGFTVFAISQRDPQPRHAEVGLDEYFRRIPLVALDVVREITGSSQVHLVGVCAGGMLAASTAAWLAAGGETGVASLTMLMSALDHTIPDDSGDPWAEVEIEVLTRILSNRAGLVHGGMVGVLFDLLRSRDTVWQPLVSGWLLGERPKSFDIWAWSEDWIDVPPVLFRQALRIAVDNTLARGRLRIAGRLLDLSAVTQDAFVVAGTRDHISPWETVYRSARLLGGDVAFHLVPSGHVGGIISPPRPKAAYRTRSGGLPADPSAWSADSVARQESWWSAWSRWLASRSGPRVPGRATGSARHPAGSPAPGHHVRSR
ncbi:polyhydroxyalkanoate synthase [Saccharothrix tamanrassetensis]|uniref:Polyhydroxyalkanoate synthase n=1 Tax=Saccharothrix tamanrassetensis TaxID=1051531 RepID=A0A841CCN7_9PSEU|nr:alpha/beta fold hydrolase [Saccharothrix tamanrassetensis]MBB5953938.1 polyhydroxyalkanoate synthase [Saccharothrix tamanrassetensis]